MLAAMLTIVLVAIVLALVKDGEFDVIPAEEPVYTCAWGPAAAATPNNPCVPGALNTSDHVPGGAWKATRQWKRCGRPHRRT